MTDMMKYSCLPLCSMSLYHGEHHIMNLELHYEKSVQIIN